MTALPEFGLVCLTKSDEIHFRTLTRTRYLQLDEEGRRAKLRELYQDNLQRLLGALEFCRARGIHLYRMTSQLFPMSDLEDGIGAQVLQELAEQMPEVGRRADEYGIRIVVHPDQFVVLSSDRPEVVENSVEVLRQHARNLDMMNLPQSTWSTLLIHGGKGGRAEQLIERTRALPHTIHSRLSLENDEHVYGAAEILSICRAAGVPFVFDVHHHVIKEKLTSFDDPSIAHYVQEARTTWPDPEWQVVHLSNGKEGLLDRRHSDLVDVFPPAFLGVRWIEVEAKGKEDAIAALQARFASDASPPAPELDRTGPRG